MSPVIATSYEGFWVVWVLIVIMAAVVLALPIGIVAILVRKRNIALVCGGIWLAFGVWTFVCGVQEESSDSRRLMVFGALVALVGLVLMVFRRKPALPP
jgi:hypothetical protein